MIRLELTTMDFGEKQTRGRLDVFKNNTWLFSLSTLEQEWNNNKKSDSCLPPGFYSVEHVSTEKHPDSFLLKGTEPRTAIMIHILNYYYQSEGCIGVGLGFKDMNKDGLYDLLQSTDAMNMLREVCKNETVIFINIKR